MNSEKCNTLIKAWPVGLVAELMIESAMVQGRRGELYRLAAVEIERLQTGVKAIASANQSAVTFGQLKQFARDMLTPNVSSASSSTTRHGE